MSQQADTAAGVAKAQRYVDRSLTLVRMELARTAPEFAESVVLEPAGAGLGLLSIEIGFALAWSVESSPLDSKGTGEAPELGGLEEITTLLKQAASERMDQVSSRAFVDHRAGYPRLPDSIVVADRALALVYRHPCDTCGGKKLCACVACKGHGGVKCTRCDGAGDVVCHECRGEGTVGPDRERCRSCHGHRRLKCDACHGHRLVTCKVCKGKRKVTCEACTGTGVSRTLMWAQVVATPLFVAKTVEGPPEVLGPALEFFGGVRQLRAAFGNITRSERIGPKLKFEFQVPFALFDASCSGATSRLAVAGVTPAVIASGDFLEHALSASFRQLEERVGETSAFFCDQLAVRAALREFLSLTPHRQVISSPGAEHHGVSSGYRGRVIQLAGSALKALRVHLLVTRCTGGLIAAPLGYALAHRVLGVSFAAALPWIAAVFAGLWISVDLSLRLTVASMTQERELRRALLNL